MLFRGSSPLARGLPPSTENRIPPARIIPARAGFTHPPVAVFRDNKDHPRSRGVYGSSSLSLTIIMGSSPLARGLRSVIEEDGLLPGIIPARAGFTSNSP